MARRQLHDRYFKQAKTEGYLARSAYKLLQIQELKKIMRTSDRVLDLGCAPGAWIQVALNVIGPRGRIIGVDLKEVRHAFDDRVTLIQGDAFEIDPAELTGPAGGLFNCVLSDMAPNTSGHGDAERSARLCWRVLELAPDILAPAGNLAMKVLEGTDYPNLLKDTKGMFAQVKGYKPKASRDVSREMYIIAHGSIPGRSARMAP